MLDPDHAPTPSAEPHLLAGSTRPGSGDLARLQASCAAPGPTVQPFGIAASGVGTEFAMLPAAPAQPGAHPDMEVIDLAGRVKRLAERDAAAEPAIQRLDAQVRVNNPMPGGDAPSTDWDRCASRRRAAEEASGLARRWKVRARMLRRLVRWVDRLTGIEPRTMAGLAAKAAASLAVRAGDRFNHRSEAIAEAVQRDAVRLATAPKLKSATLAASPTEPHARPAGADWRSRLVPLIRREDRVSRAANHFFIGTPEWDRSEKLCGRMKRRMGRWVKRLMRGSAHDARAAAFKADVYLELTAGGWTNRTKHWADRLGIDVARDTLHLGIAQNQDPPDAMIADLLGARHPDAKLLALGQLWERSCHRDDQAHRDLVEAEARYDAPALPEALFLDPERDPPALAAYSSDHIPSGRRWYSPHVIPALRKLWHYTFCLERRDEILAEYDAWAAAGIAAREQAGILEAEVKVRATSTENTNLRAAIYRLPARTRAGIDLKVKVIVWLHDGLDNFGQEMSREDIEDPQFSSGLALSLALDLARAGTGVAQSIAQTVDLASAA